MAFIHPQAASNQCCSNFTTKNILHSSIILTASLNKKTSCIGFFHVPQSECLKIIGPSKKELGRVRIRMGNAFSSACHYFGFGSIISVPVYWNPVTWNLVWTQKNWRQDFCVARFLASPVDDIQIEEKDFSHVRRCLADLELAVWCWIT